MNRLDAAVLRFFDQMMVFFHQFDIPRIMVLRVFLVMWIVTCVFASVLENHKVSLFLSAILFLIIIAFTTTEIMERTMTPEQINGRILRIREQRFSSFIRWGVYVIFAYNIVGDALVVFYAMKPTLLILIGFVSTLFWFLLMIGSDALAPMGPKKKKEKKVKISKVAPALQ